MHYVLQSFLLTIYFIFYSLSHSVLNSNTAMEEDFPRGGASVATPLEVRQIRNEAERDVLFEVMNNYRGAWRKALSDF